jgi:hypothetical protein
MIESLIFAIKFLGLLFVVLFLIAIIVGIVSSWFSWFKSQESNAERELELYLTALQELKKPQEDEKNHKE